MFNLRNIKRSNYSASDLSEFEDALSDYWEKSRASESEAISDLGKHLWLANGTAATISVGFIQAAQKYVSCWQYAGAWAFICGIVALLLLKYISTLQTSRDRHRFQDAKSRFDAEEVTDDIFYTIRDGWFSALKITCLILQWGAGVVFAVGLIFTLVGVQHGANILVNQDCGNSFASPVSLLRGVAPLTLNVRSHLP
ncbi:MAG TPA: hypothetical protein V6D19_13635 [Stenomitos sp.]